MVAKGDDVNVDITVAGNCFGCCSCADGINGDCDYGCVDVVDLMGMVMIIMI